MSDTAPASLPSFLTPAGVVIDQTRLIQRPAQQVVIRPHIQQPTISPAQSYDPLDLIPPIQQALNQAVDQLQKNQKSIHLTIALGKGLGVKYFAWVCASFINCRLSNSEVIYRAGRMAVQQPMDNMTRFKEAVINNLRNQYRDQRKAFVDQALSYLFDAFNRANTNIQQKLLVTDALVILYAL